MKAVVLFLCCLLLSACTEREADIAFRTMHAVAVSSLVAAEIAADVAARNQQEAMRQQEELEYARSPHCEYEEFTVPREDNAEVWCTKYEDCSVECDE
jgi:hypothetical protein